MTCALGDEEVLQRYDQYVLRFLEPLNVCPFAKRARESGTLHRRVMRGEAPSVAQAVAGLQHLTAGDAGLFEVGVLVLPDVPGEAQPFARFVSRVREAFTLESTPPGGYYLVAMHPGHTMDLSSPQRAVAFMRRTPHPSIQVARASVIAAARGAPQPSGETTSEVVARVGLAAVLGMGPDKVLALLDSIAKGHT